MTKGADFVYVKEKRVKNKHTPGHRRQWNMTFINVPEHAVEDFKNNKAIVALHHLQGCRLKLKREIKEMLRI